MTSRRKRQKLERDSAEGGGPKSVSKAGSAEAPSTEVLFRSGEVLTKEEIERRLEESGLVKKPYDELYRLVKKRFFKRHQGQYIVRGDGD